MASAWTYDPTSVLDHDRVRRLCGDTNEAKKLIDDGEVADAIVLGVGSVFRMAAYACDFIAAKLARDKSTSVQGVSTDREDAYNHYVALAVKYRRKATTSAALFTVSDPDEKKAFRDNTSLLEPTIKKGMHDFEKRNTNDFKSA